MVEYKADIAAIPCPTCGAEPGRSCGTLRTGKRPAGSPTEPPHVARWKAAAAQHWLVHRYPPGPAYRPCTPPDAAEGRALGPLPPPASHPCILLEQAP